MPHVVIEYTANLEPDADMATLCRTLAATLVAQRDAEGARVFPIGGTRVLAYPAHTFAVADGEPDRAFVYLNVRIATGRSAPVVKATGEALLAAVKAHFAAPFERRPLGITLQIDEGEATYDAKHSNLHPLFKGR